VTVAKRRAVVAPGAWSPAHRLAALLANGPLRALVADHDRVRAFAEAFLAAPNQPS
jgi:hypothetical protein